MLPKPKRLNLKKDFKWVASGKKADSKFATVFVKSGQNSFPKVGIAISSKYFKKASDRNRVRRIVSAALEMLYLKFPANMNIVVLPKAGVLDVKSPEVLKDLEEEFKKANFI